MICLETLCAVDVCVCTAQDVHENYSAYSEHVAPRFASRAEKLMAQGGHTSEKKALCELGCGVMLAGLAGVRQDFQLVYNPYGKPELAKGKPHISLSHTDGLAVCALAQQVVGIDAEVIPAALSRYQILALGRALGFPHERWAEPAPELMERAKTPEAWAREWTRVEAVLKAIGTGFSLGPNQYLPLMKQWRCAWARCGDTIICCATQATPHIALATFDPGGWLECVEGTSHPPCS